MIDFGKPLSSGWDRMAAMLFRPFDLGKWLILGFTAWLASFLEGGTGGSFNSRSGGSKNEMAETVHKLTEWGLTTWILIVLGVALFVMGLSVLLAWLGARGQFMFLDNVVRNRAEVAAPWKEFRVAGNSLFRLMVVFYICTFALMVAFVLFALVFCWGDLVAMRMRPWAEYAPVWILLGILIVAWVPLVIVWFFYLEFAVPVMHAGGCGAWAAARRIAGLATESPLDFFVYLVIRVAMGLLFLVVRIIVGCGTCCIGFLPYVSAVFTLPLKVFRLNFTLDCLVQFGPEFDLRGKAGLPPQLQP